MFKVIGTTEYSHLKKNILSAKLLKGNLTPASYYDNTIFIYALNMRNTKLKDLIKSAYSLKYRENNIIREILYILSNDILRNKSSIPNYGYNSLISTIDILGDIFNHHYTSLDIDINSPLGDKIFTTVKISLEVFFKYNFDIDIEVPLNKNLLSELIDKDTINLLLDDNIYSYISYNNDLLSSLLSFNSRYCSITDIIKFLVLDTFESNSLINTVCEYISENQDNLSEILKTRLTELHLPILDSLNIKYSVSKIIAMLTSPEYYSEFYDLDTDKLENFINNIKSKFPKLLINLSNISFKSLYEQEDDDLDEDFYIDPIIRDLEVDHDSQHLLDIQGNEVPNVWSLTISYPNIDSLIYKTSDYFNCGEWDEILYFENYITIYTTDPIRFISYDFLNELVSCL